MTAHKLQRLTDRLPGGGLEWEHLAVLYVAFVPSAAVIGSITATPTALLGASAIAVAAVVGYQRRQENRGDDG